jgi:glutaminyl-tRNA synthetase
VETNQVNGWDDPRMPTISGLRRRGFTAASVRNFIAQVGITKKDNVIDMLVLENAVRDDLDPIAPRAMAVLRPLKLIIENYEEGKTEHIEVANHPKDDSLGTRTVSLSRELFIDHDDFMQDPPAKFFRLGPGREVRLRNAFVVRCNDVIRDDSGNVIELRCEYLEQTRNGRQPEGRKVKGIIHWVNALDAMDAEVRLYDRLFELENPLADKEKDFKQAMNPNSLVTLKQCKLEASLANADADMRYQFERTGYFFPDLDSTERNLIFNRIVTLRDSWAKIGTKQS